MHNPLASKLAPWRMAQRRKSFINWLTLPMSINEQFWKTWSSVMFPEPKKIK